MHGDHEYVQSNYSYIIILISFPFLLNFLKIAIVNVVEFFVNFCEIYQYF